MTAFVDTSALFALLDEDDSNHGPAIEIFEHLRGEELVTHAYVFVETLALVSRRLGWPAAERLLDGIMAVVHVALVDAPIHEAALGAYREAGASRVSFVDRASFGFMRAYRVERAFAFDSDFVIAGFELAA